MMIQSRLTDAASFRDLPGGCLFIALFKEDLSGNRDNHVGGTGGFSHIHLFILI
jgi:hypothetical protein